MVRKAVCPWPGLERGFLPTTKEMQKELLPVVDKQLIQYSVEAATSAKILERLKAILTERVN